MEVKDGTLIMSKDERRAIDALTRIEKSSAWDRASAYIIIHPDGKQWGKLKIAHPVDGMGPLHAFFWSGHDDDGLQYGKASGCGYDKLSAAMQGLRCGPSIVFADHPRNWETTLREAGYRVIQAL